MNVNEIGLDSQLSEFGKSSISHKFGNQNQVDLTSISNTENPVHGSLRMTSIKPGCKMEDLWKTG